MPITSWKALVRETGNSHWAIGDTPYPQMHMLRFPSLSICTSTPAIRTHPPQAPLLNPTQEEAQPTPASIQNVTPSSQAAPF